MENLPKQTTNKKNSDASTPAEDRQDLLSPTREMQSTPSSAKPRAASSIYAGQNRFLGKLSRKKIISFAAIAILVIGAGTALAIRNITKNNESPEASIASETLPTETLQKLKVEDEEIDTATKVSIKGELEVNNSITISPSSRPLGGRLGQIYFDGQVGEFLYFDGQSYRTIATDTQLSSVSSAINQTQSALSASQGELSSQLTTSINSQNAYIEGVVRTLQRASGDISLVAGNGVALNGLEISNAGVTQLQGTANQVMVSGSTGDITISLPQDINIGATPHFAGIVLDSPLSLTSGGTGTDGSDLVNNSLVYFDGTKLATIDNPSDPFLCLVSTFNAPVFMPCANALPDSVNSLNGMTGDIIVMNADVDAASKTITPHVASTLRPGIVSTTAQTFSGLKTFNAGIKLGHNEAITADTAITIQPANNQNVILGTAGHGKIIISNLDCSASGNGGKLTVNAANEIICAEDTGGDGVGIVSVSAEDNSIWVNNTDGANPKISVNLQGGGGLATTSNGLGLIDTCEDQEVLKYNAGSGNWICGQDADTTDDTCSSCVSLQSTTPGTAQSGHINIDGTVMAGSASFAEDTSVGGNLMVNGTGIIRTSTNSGQAFEVQSTEGAAALSVNTNNMSVTAGAFSVGNELPQTSVFAEAYLGSNLAGAHKMLIHGNYAYTLLSQYSYVVIHDISVPGEPRHVQNFNLAGIGTTPRSLAISGDTMYVGSGQCCNYRLMAFDISDPESPDYLTSFNLGHTPTTLSVSGDYIYNPNGGNGLFQVVDTSNPLLMHWEANPRPSLAAGSSPSDSAIRGDYLYYTDNNLNRLVAWNISDPANPFQAGFAATNSGAEALKISGDHAFVINQTAGTMQIFNLSNPASPSLVSTTTTLSHPSAIDIVGSRVFVTGFSVNRLQMIDASNLESPTALPVTSPTFTGPMDVNIYKGYAYVVSQTNGRLEVFALSPGNALTVNGNSLIEGSLSAHSGSFAGNITADTLESNTVIVQDTLYTTSIDTTNSASLEIGSTNATSININQNMNVAAGKTVMIQGDTAIQHNSVAAFSVSDSESANLFNIDTSTKNISIGVAGLGGGTPSGGGGSGGSFDAPSEPTGSASTTMLPWDISVTDEYAYVSNLASNTLEIFDVSDSAAPTAVGSASIGGATYVDSDGTTAVLSVSNQMRIIDVSNPTAPSPKGVYVPNGGGTIWDLYVRGNHAYLVYKASNNSSYVEAVDISDPDNPAFISRTTMGTGATALHAAMDGDFIYVAMQGEIPPFSTLRAFNISNPNSISMINRALNTGNGQDPRAIAAKDSIVWVAFNDTNRIVAFDYTNPSSSSQNGTITTSSTIVDMAMSPTGSYLLALNNAQELFTYDVTDINNMSHMVTAPTVTNSTTQSRAVAANSHAIYVIHSSGSQNLSVLSTGTPSSPGGGTGPTIFFNQNTMVHEGATFTSKGDTTIKADSAAAFKVQTAAGDDILSVNTNSGEVIMSQLNVSGATDLDSLTVTQATSLATLTVSGAATFQTTLTVNGHIITGGSAPAASQLPALGTGSNCTVAGNDTSGTITITAGSDSSNGLVCDISFAQTFASTPRPMISSTSQSGAILGVYVDNVTTSKLSVGLSVAPSAGQSYTFNYWNPQ